MQTLTKIFEKNFSNFHRRNSVMDRKDSWIRRDHMRFYPAGMPGSGAGKGGGAGGSVRESGGRLGEYGAAQEELYFFNKQKEQLEKIKKKAKLDKASELSQKQEDK